MCRCSTASNFRAAEEVHARAWLSECGEHHVMIGFQSLFFFPIETIAKLRYIVFSPATMTKLRQIFLFTSMW